MQINTKTIIKDLGELLCLAVNINDYDQKRSDRLSELYLGLLKNEIVILPVEKINDTEIPKTSKETNNIKSSDFSRLVDYSD